MRQEDSDFYKSKMDCRKGLPHKKPIASETDARKMKPYVRLGGLKEAPASIGGEYFTAIISLEV